MKKEPLISVVTVSLNSAKTIEKTIISILDQTYKNIEYIIIDGGSTDGTVDIIKKYDDRISYWVSEKDRGIYDAMNKGIDIAKGSYINFMNADDYFFNNDIVKSISTSFNNKYDLIYGDTEMRLKKHKFKLIAQNPKYLWISPPIHQSTFTKRKTLQKYKYNIKNKLVADFELLLNIYYNNGKILKINKIISSYSTDGISGKKSDQVVIDYYKTLTKFKNDIFVKANFNILKIINEPWKIIRKIL